MFRNRLFISWNCYLRILRRKVFRNFQDWGILKKHHFYVHISGNVCLLFCFSITRYIAPQPRAMVPNQKSKPRTLQIFDRQIYGQIHRWRRSPRHKIKFRCISMEWNIAGHKTNSLNIKLFSEADRPYYHISTKSN